MKLLVIRRKHRGITSGHLSGVGFYAEDLKSTSKKSKINKRHCIKPTSFCLYKGDNYDSQSSQV